MKEIHELKVGDKIELRDDLEHGEIYGSISYWSEVPKISYISDIFNTIVEINESKLGATPEMISKVNGKKVKFINRFKYIIEKEADEMIDPKSLVQSGDFVIYEQEGKEYNSIAIQRGDYLGLAIHPVG